jgi:hypothetical protein
MFKTLNIHSFSQIPKPEIVNIQKSLNYVRIQWFSTWVRLTLGVRYKLSGGMQNKINTFKMAHLGRIFNLGVCKGEKILIWGYASTKRLRTAGLDDSISD